MSVLGTKRECFLLSNLPQSDILYTVFLHVPIISGTALWRLHTPVIRISIGSHVHTLNVAFKNTGGTQWRSWLRHCGTIRKVAGSIPDGVTGILH